MALMTPRQASHELGLPERTILAWIAATWLVSQRSTHGQRIRHRVELEDVRRVMEDRCVQPRRRESETRIGKHVADLLTRQAEHVKELADLRLLIQSQTKTIADLWALVAERPATAREPQPQPHDWHTEPIANHPAFALASPYARPDVRPESPPGLPSGTVRLIHFSKRHKVPDGTLKSQADRGDVPHTARPTASRDGREERWATPADQIGIIDYWRRAQTWYTPCDTENCPCSNI